MSFKQITTQGGERWDNIALDAYGDASKMNKIINANPGVKITDVLPSGIYIDIPIIPVAEVKTDLERLPPWKQ